jgi:hypothetical protein
MHIYHRQWLVIDAIAGADRNQKAVFLSHFEERMASTICSQPWNACETFVKKQETRADKTGKGLRTTFFSQPWTPRRAKRQTSRANRG